jgi:integrase
MPFAISADIADDKDLPYLWLKPAKGEAAAYYRRSRVKGQHVVRLRGADGRAVMPGQVGFRAAWEKAHREYERSHQAQREEEIAHPFGIANLVRDYQASEDWRRLGPVSQEAYTRRCRILMETIDPLTNLSTIDRRRIIALQTTLVTGRRGKRAPSAANEGVKMLSTLLKHAIDLGWRVDNPASDMRALETGDGQGHRAWEEEAVRAVLDHPDIHMCVKVAVATARHTGLRLGDLCAIQRDARRNGVLTCKTQKTGAMVYLPEHPELAKWLDTMPPHTADTLLANPSGTAWTTDHLSRCITDAARRAGLFGLSCHGLRKTATIAAAEAGLSDAEIESLIPHADKKQTAYYRQQADQKVLAARAMSKLVGAQ